jgi:hypothetical protein
MSQPHAADKPHAVLQSTAELFNLSTRWVALNKTRVYNASKPARAIAAAVVAPAAAATARGGTQVHASPRPSTSVSLTLHALQPSRPRYERSAGALAATAAIDQCAGTVASELAAVEARIIVAASNHYLRAAVPYSGEASALGAAGASCARPGAASVASASMVYLTRESCPLPMQLRIPVAPPNAQQIASCRDSPSYNKNVLLNIASALASDSFSVVVGDPPVDTAACFSSPAAVAATVYLPADTVPRVMGTEKACEDALFNNARVTCSAHFEFDEHVARAYAAAVLRYQPYSNVALGEHVTLVPALHNRAPLVVSMHCPQFGMQHNLTASTGSQNHPVFGPNHATRIVELARHMAPFVKSCCEEYLALPLETREDLAEDQAMPLPRCTAVEHAFSHDAPNGFSSYVAKHTFSMDVGMLNTYAIEQAEGTARPDAGVFPAKQDVVVYTAALFGGAASRRP